jgi:hypothetical protein
MSALDQRALLSELESEFPEPEAHGDLEWLVADWAREADQTPNPAAVLRFQREDLEARTAGRDGSGRLEALRAHVLARRVDHLGARTFALGKGILAGDVADGDARARGEALREEADTFAEELRELPETPELERVRRALGDAVMEALFAIERKAMSPRLARESGDQAGPPQVR